MTTTQLPDGPRAPHLLQKLHYIRDPLGYMDAAAQRYGDIFNAPVIGNHPAVVLVSHPQALQQVFSGDAKQIIAPPNQLLQPIVGDYSIFVMEGNRHRRERRLLMPPFHGERMQAYGSLICQLTQAVIDSLTIGTVFSARSLMQDISLEVILKVVFGISDSDRFAQLKQLIVQLTDSFQSPWMAGSLFFPSLQKDLGAKSPWGYLRSLQRQMQQLLLAEIQEKRQTLANSTSEAESGNDILSLLIATRDETGQPMSDAELHDELVTLLIAGHETTATAVAWALYWIHRDATIVAQLRSELTSLGPNPNPLTISQLPYLTAVCHETLRRSPVVALTVPREVKEPVTIMGYTLAPGTRIYGCLYLTHQRPDLYPEPEQFKPDRFLDRQFSPYEFVPFGGGVRRCIGEALAQFEMKLVLATMLSHYQFSLASLTPETARRRGVVLAPSRGVQMVFNGPLYSSY